MKPDEQRNTGNSDGQSIPGPRPGKISLRDKQPDDTLNVSDSGLKETFNLLSKEERQKLDSVYERFRYGVKTSDRSKMREAASQARQLLFRERENGRKWSREAALFCGYLLRRANLYDHEVLLVGGCLEEAAYSAWREERYDLGGACAAAALLGNTSAVEDMMIILACGVVKEDDVSALCLLNRHKAKDLGPWLKTLIGEAFAAKGIRLASDKDAGETLDLLQPLYANTGMDREAEYLAFGGGDSGEASKEEKEEKEKPNAFAGPERLYGIISRLNWAQQTGTITGDDGASYTFAYRDISDDELAGTIRECMRADLGGKRYSVSFFPEDGAARDIFSDADLVDRARKLAADTSRPDRFQAAFEMCRGALGTADSARALSDLIKLGCAIYNAGQQASFLKEALNLYEKNAGDYPNGNAFAVMSLAQACSYLKRYPKMMEYAEKAMAITGLTVKQKINLLSQYLTMVREYYDISGDKALLTAMLTRIDSLLTTYADELRTDTQVRSLYNNHILHHRITIECGLDMLEAAEADYAEVPAGNTNRPALEMLLATARERLSRKGGAGREELLPPEETFDSGTSQKSFPTVYEKEAVEEEEIVPYEDKDGWDALKLTKKDVVDYALSAVTGPDRIPILLAYLRAAASLRKELLPVYRTAALAAADPMEAPDYSLTALFDAMAGSDTDYPELNDCCMGAAFLRASFLSDQGYDYSTQGLRDSISVSQQIPALGEAYDTLEEFRRETGRGMDIYAGYRSHGVRKLREELDAAVRRADELYTKFILTPAREGAKFARILETKKVVFARDGYLATMLRHILEQDLEALAAEKENFARVYLGGAAQLSPKHISSDAVNELIEECWDQAGKNMQIKKASATLQGNRRTNLFSNISEILTGICQWYALSEQNDGLAWKTPQGEEACRLLAPRLMEQLDRVADACGTELKTCTDPERSAGLWLLADAARELTARLDGSWKFGQERYRYADFLRGNEITLGADFMPELSSTFCALPEFNVLARIRRHAEAPRRSFQEQIDRIYGQDRTCNDYGTAARITEYLEAMGGEETVRLPQEPERFLEQTEQQIDMSFRGFLETYALAESHGQIIKSDAFCSSLEDTVRYWYAHCRETKNYGFFTSILRQAEEQIHASARQYETQLEEQLDALIAGNRQHFDAHPDHAEEIRRLIADQNFTVAEDWMARIRIGDFSLEMQQPEALRDLEDFWNSCAGIYRSVADASRPLGTLLKRRGPSKDVKWAQMLTDSWLYNGRPSNPERIGKLLELLGWQSIHVQFYPFPTDPRAEIYEVRRERSTAGPIPPQHPIAAYGSALEKKRMYVVCLYGVYDCDRLYEKMRAMDVIDGSKIFLLDYALGQTDRRTLARTLKKRESGLRNVNIVIDRVLVTYLAEHCNAEMVNRTLMATAMPFAYCQPYVVESALTMPPEIFIGRKDELQKIEQSDGVNLIYGGRQLGKSALLKKALSDLDGHSGQRAVLVDIKGLDCAAAARKLSARLIDLDITPDGEVTEDWDILCRNIERQLREKGEKIAYFLLMLDEADAFINDCADCGYRPLVAMKDLQQSLPGQFKYVLAGLHDIVKFNRQVALGNNSVITHIPSLKITPFRTPEAEELLTGPLSYLGFSLPSKVTVSQILATCNYFPGLIQLYARKLIESVRAADYAGYDIKKTPPYVVSDEHLRRVMADKEFVEQIHEKFEITLTLDQDQGSCYYPLTLLIGWMYSEIPSKSGYTARDVVRYSRELGIYPLANLDEEKISALLMELQDLNILRGVSNDSYLLASKNFRDLLGSDDEIFTKLLEFGGEKA